MEITFILVPFFWSHMDYFKHGLKTKKKKAKFTSQINLKLTLVTKRNVLSSTIFAINLTCKWTWPILFNWTCWSNIFWHPTKSCSLLLSLNLTSSKSQCAFFNYKKRINQGIESTPSMHFTTWIWNKILIDKLVWYAM